MYVEEGNHPSRARGRTDGEARGPQSKRGSGYIGGRRKDENGRRTSVAEDARLEAEEYRRLEDAAGLNGHAEVDPIHGNSTSSQKSRFH